MKPVKINTGYLKKIKKKDPGFAEYFESFYDNFQQVVRSSPIYIKHIRDVLNNGDQYYVSLPKAILDKVKSGDYEKVFNRDTGLWNGMVRRASDGKEIIKQANWKELDFSNEQLQNIHQMAIQASLAEVSSKLNTIETKIDEVKLGQNSDRINQIITGIELYKESFQRNKSKQQLDDLTNALQSIKTGKNQLKGEIENFFKIHKREASSFDKVWGIIGVDKPETEILSKIEKSQYDLTESVKYIIIAYSFEIKIRLLQEEYDLAETIKSDLIKYVDNFAFTNNKLFDYIEPSLRKNIISSNKELIKIKKSVDKDANILIEITN